MAYRQQAPYAHAAPYGDGPRSAPLQSPQEYRQDGYHHDQEQGGYYGAYNEDNGQYDQQWQPSSRQPPPRRVTPQTAPLAHAYGPPRHEEYGGPYADASPVDGRQLSHSQASYSARESGHQTGRMGPQHYDPGYGPRGSQEGHRDHYYEQNGPQGGRYGDGYQQNNGYGEQRPQPQRAHSDGLGNDHISANAQSYGQPPHSAPGIAVKPRNLALPLQKPSSRGRMAQEPQTPDTLAWDNPFPVFPTGRQGKAPGSAHGDERPSTSGSSRSPAASMRSAETYSTPLSSRSSDQRSFIRDSASSARTGTTLESINEKSIRQSDSSSHAYGTARSSHGEFNYDARAGSDPYAKRSASTEEFGPLPRSRTMPANMPNDTSFHSLPIRQPASNTSNAQYRSISDRWQPVAPFQQPIAKQVRSGSFDVAHTRDRPFQDSTGSSVASPFADDEDMPNFEAAEQALRKNSLTAADLHIASKQDASSKGENRGRASSKGQGGDHGRQIYRSRSQPNFRGPSQPTQEDYKGFDFGIPQSQKPMPAADAHPRPNLHGSHMRPNADLYREGGSMQRRPSPLGPQGDIQGRPGKKPVRLGHEPGQAHGVPQSRTRDIQSPGPSPHMRPYDRSNHANKIDSRGPPRLNTARQDPHRNPSPGASPSAGMSPISPLNSRTMNPDALPEHPTPSRRGLSPQAQRQGSGSHPSPMRQYNNNNASMVPDISPQPVNPQPPSIVQADTDRPVTHEELNRLRQLSNANPGDQATSLTLAKKMTEALYVLADEGGRADPKSQAKNREMFASEAKRILKKLVSQNYPDAMFFLADCYGSGTLGLQEDAVKAFSLYQSAAKLGHAQSAYRVAVCCELGQDEGGGTRRDPQKAVQWYKRAATLGDPPAQYKVGMISLKGLFGQPQNQREAVVWLKRAAERADADNPHALHELGNLYESGGGSGSGGGGGGSNDAVVVRDEAHALSLFRHAADLGYKFSQYRLGTCYEYGALGCAIDPRQSIAWYSRAAVQGEHQSELALSGWYLTGSDGVVQQSDTEAYLWARRAAQAGLPKAEYAMGYFTEVGIGAPADLEAAKRWYWKAAAQNFPKAKERLEELRKGGGAARAPKARVSRNAVQKTEGDCTLM